MKIWWGMIGGHCSVVQACTIFCLFNVVCLSLMLMNANEILSSKVPGVAAISFYMIFLLK